MFQSQITLRIFYVYENESIDLTTKPETFEWKIKIKENQQEMLEKLERKCMRKLIALPDQKSLINYLMAIFDGERISARIK